MTLNQIRGWLNWKNILTTAFLAGSGWLYHHATGAYTLLTSTAAQVVKNTEELGELNDPATGVKSQLNRVIGLLEERNQFDLTITGTALIGSTGAGEAYVEINELSRAAVYSSRPSVKVTNLSRRDRPSFEFPIAGTFSDERVEVRIMLSRRASDRLRAEGNHIQVRLEPGRVRLEQGLE